MANYSFTEAKIEEKLNFHEYDFVIMTLF